MYVFPPSCLISSAVRTSSILMYTMGHCGCSLNFPNHHVTVVLSCEQKQPELYLPLALCQIRLPTSAQHSNIPCMEGRKLWSPQHPVLHPFPEGLELGLFPKGGPCSGSLCSRALLQEINPCFQSFGNLESCHFPKHLLSYSVKSPHCISLEKNRNHPGTQLLID